MQELEAGYNLVILSFYIINGPTAMAQCWSELSDEEQIGTMRYAHTTGAKIPVSAGGSTSYPYNLTVGVNFGSAVAQWATMINLDGVDFDLENFDSSLIADTLDAQQTIEWIIDASNTARRILGD